MINKMKPDAKIQQLETEIIGLKVRIARVESYIRSFPDPTEYVEPYIADSGEETENMINDAIRIVSEYDRASASLLQRRLSVGYARASRIMDVLEKRKIVAPSVGSSKPREVYKGQSM